ncbi:hypothetical protein ZIOFF_031254 [Zingiber officinale]|uniref:Uncharacterized protein n=1 Tax=Zingiber officinale TaxID=94328 RepID=A0A8J5LAM1_ZINOF|nr:hypothetical protein ZIOFF_031254 [Zingiber officinale]
MTDRLISSPPSPLTLRQCNHSRSHCLLASSDDNAGFMIDMLKGSAVGEATVASNRDGGDRRRSIGACGSPSGSAEGWSPFDASAELPRVNPASGLLGGAEKQIRLNLR